MTDKSIKAILYIEMENKKWYQAQWRTFCGECGGDIDEGDDYVYLGEKGHKVCSECFGDITNYLEED